MGLLSVATCTGLSLSTAGGDIVKAQVSRIRGPRERLRLPIEPRLQRATLASQSESLFPPSVPRWMTF
jgi:hypothetical protein